MRSAVHQPTLAKWRSGTPTLRGRELLTLPQATELAGMFRLLANETRLRMLHALARAGEISVSELAREVGMSPQAVSNQLQRLVDRRALAARRAGNTIYYRIVDPCIPALLDLGWCSAEMSARPHPSRLLAHV